jgi:uncharacterized protein (TIGR02453 family)
MTFRGWPAEAITFYEALEADNSKTFWHAHKDVYERAVRAPMEALLADLEDEFGAGRVFRPNRDIRFSRDKSPYKLNIAATLERGGYLSFSADGLGAGCGLYMPASDQLDRYRRAVADDPTGGALATMVTALRKQGIEISGHEELRTAPKGYPKDHPRIDLLRQKGLITWRSWPPGAWLHTKKAKDRVVEFLHTSRPVVQWLNDNVGDSTHPDAYRR